VGQTDYLLRLIEEVGRTLIELRRMMLGGESGPADMEAELQRVAGEAGLDLDLLRSMSVDTLEMLISPTGELEPGKCWITAEILAVDGHRANAEGDVDGARDRWEQALRLYTLLEPGILARGLPEVGSRVREVQDDLASLDRGLDRG